MPREERTWLFGDADAGDELTTVVSPSTFVELVVDSPPSSLSSTGRRRDLTLLSSQLRSVRQTKTLSSPPSFSSSLAPRAANADLGIGRFSGKSGRYRGSELGLRYVEAMLDRRVGVVVRFRARAKRRSGMLRVELVTAENADREEAMVPDRVFRTERIGSFGYVVNVGTVALRAKMVVRSRHIILNFSTSLVLIEVALVKRCAFLWREIALYSGQGPLYVCNAYDLHWAIPWEKHKSMEEP